MGCRWRHNEAPIWPVNMHVGGKSAPVKVTDAMLELVDTARPNLIEDGVFLVGRDVVGDTLMGQRVRPWRAGEPAGVYDGDFTKTVIEALKTTVALRLHYGPNDYARLATLRARRRLAWPWSLDCSTGRPTR